VIQNVSVNQAKFVSISGVETMLLQYVLANNNLKLNY
jgi:hypothetical protein